MNDDEYIFKEEWPKKCSCGAVHDEDAWEKLHYVGIQKGIEEVPDLELRNCSKCSSTIAQPVVSDFNGVPLRKKKSHWW